MGVGSVIYVSLAACTAPGRVAVEGIGATVVEETEKAVKLEASTEKGKAITAWFPKKALKAEIRSHSLGEYEVFTLAKWFKIEGWTSRWIELARSVSVLSAA